MMKRQPESTRIHGDKYTMREREGRVRSSDLCQSPSRSTAVITAIADAQSEHAQSEFGVSIAFTG